MQRLLYSFLFFVTFALPCLAFNTIRDAETEEAMKAYARPILSAAGYPENALQLYVVNSEAINAFVAGGSNIFIHTGLLLACDRPEMVQGVLAHELGHITGGHLVRTTEVAENSMLTQGITTLAGIAAAAAGQGALGQGIISAGSHIAQAGFFAYSRGQEQAADQAGLTYLSDAHVSAKGILDVLEVLRQRERLAPDGGVPYLRSHPLTRERIAHVRNEVMQSTVQEVPPPQSFRLIHAKLKAFLSPLESVRREYNGDKSVEGRYGMAVVHFRASELDKALALMNGLIAEQPGNAYFQELKGQMLFENGKVAEAAEAYSKAYTLNGHALIGLGYAEALVARKKGNDNQEAEKILRKVVTAEPRNLQAWNLIGKARQQRGDEAGALLAQAESAYVRGKYKDVVRFAKQAKEQFKEGTTDYLRADDLIRFGEKEKEEQEKREG